METSKSNLHLHLNKAFIFATQVSEVTRACRLAKTRIINSNLLDHGDVENTLEEVSNLPYQNAVEAIEFSHPSIMTNGT